MRCGYADSLSENTPRILTDTSLVLLWVTATSILGADEVLWICSMQLQEAVATFAMQQALPWSGRPGPALGLRQPHQQLRAVASTSCNAAHSCCTPVPRQPPIIIQRVRQPQLFTTHRPCSPLRFGSRRSIRREAGRSDGWGSGEGALADVSVDRVKAYLHCLRFVPCMYAGENPHPSASASRSGKLESTAIPQAIRVRVEDAAEALGGRVTVGDVAARAGVSLSDAERALNALAADAQGVLEVGTQKQCMQRLDARGASLACNAV